MVKHLLKFALAAFLVLAPAAAFAQAVPTAVYVNPGVWTDLGPGPLNVQAMRAGAVVGLAASCPATNTAIAGSFELAFSTPSRVVPLATSLHVCVQGYSNPSVIVFSPLFPGQQPYAAAQSPLAPSSGNVAAGTATATFAATAAKTNYISGFTVTGLGATAGACVNVTVAGLISGSLIYPYCVPTGVTTAATALNVTFPAPIPASAVNTAITVSLPTVGAGNTSTIVNAFGYRQ
jgi:hypothetical protein